MKGGRNPVEEAQVVIGLVVRREDVISVALVVFEVVDVAPLPPLALAREVDGQLPQDGQSGVRAGVDGHLVGEDGAHAQREEAGDGRGQGGGQEASRGTAAAAAGTLVLEVLMREYLGVWLFPFQLSGVIRKGSPQYESEKVENFSE